jgi:RHS repeat-associated protein
VSISGTRNYQYRYDGAGNRVEAIRNGNLTRYINSASGSILAEANGSNVIQAYYIYGAGLLAMVTPGGQFYCYHFDGTGNTAALTDANKAVVNEYAYTPFGIIGHQQEAFPQPFKYVGQHGVMAEPNGFYYMRARYYDPVIGRFVSEDPIGFDGGDVNLYAYVQNNPVNGIDPTGLINLLAGGGVSLAGITGADASSGIVINPGLSGYKAGIKSFASAGPSVGVNVSADAFLGFMFGDLDNVRGTTANVNISLGPISVTLFYNPNNGEWMGGTLGIGPSSMPVQISSTYSYTNTASLNPFAKQKSF